MILMMAEIFLKIDFKMTLNQVSQWKFKQYKL